nr:PREDICTED: probable cytochrome P450 305a1 [Bemisia tabaci]
MDQTILLSLCLIFSCFLFLLKNYRRSSKLPPGPRGIPIFGNLFLIKRLSRAHGGLHRAFQQISREQKSSILGLHFGSSLVVVLFGRKYMKMIMSEEAFQGRPDNLFTRLRTMGERRGITILDGPVFHEQRKFAVRHLSQLGFQKNEMKAFIQMELKHFLDFLKPREGNVCINPLLTSAVLNVIWTFVADRRFSYDDPFLNDWFDLFNRRGKVFDLSGGLLSQFPWIRFLAPEKSGYNLILKINAELKKFMDTEIERHKANESTEPRDFIDVYLREIKAAGPDSPVFNEDQLIAVCLDFFIAGLHTTSDSLTFALIAMVKFPEVQTKVQKCLDEVLSVDEIPHYDDRQRLPYIEAVLLESMRYTHVVPFIGPRRVMQDVVVDGYRIPKNTLVFGDLDEYYRSQDSWGDPENFRPERFIRKNGEVISEDKHFFFGRGARSCIGNVLAKQFVFTFFCGILKKYKLSLAPSSKMPGEIPGITTKPEPFFVSMTQRGR